MKTPKAGQFTWIRGVQYRAKKRKDGCLGCDLDDFFLCPNITDIRSCGEPPLSCAINNIILKKV